MMIYCLSEQVLQDAIETNGNNGKVAAVKGLMATMAPLVLVPLYDAKLIVDHVLQNPTPDPLDIFESGSSVYRQINVTALKNDNRDPVG